MRRASQSVVLVQARLRRTRNGRRRLGEASDLLAPVLAEVAAQGIPEATGWVLQGLQFSGTQVVVMKVGPDGSPSTAIVKMPTTADGIASQVREAGVLAALARERRLGDFADLVAARLAQGQVEGRPFTVERAVPGVDGRGLMDTPERAGRIVGAAAGVVGDLRRRTSRTLAVDADVVEHWVGERVRVLGAATRDRAALGRLESLLAGHWQGRTVVVSWVHGDFWPANVMFDPETLAVTGIIDWEWAGPGELPAHDLLYLLVHTRMLAEGRELGDVLPPLLAGAAWTPDEEAVLEEGGILEPGRRTVERETLLAMWLRHVSYNLMQSPGDAHNWVWTGRNIDPILRLI